MLLNRHFLDLSSVLKVSLTKLVSQIYCIFLVTALSIGFAQEFDLESKLLLVSVEEDVHF